jgi:branched-chain amino acid aminotransferase
MSLRQLAKDMGLEVEERPILADELSGFDEVGACGTAAVISPIKRIYDSDLDKEYLYGTEPGKISVKLYEKLRGIQYGTEEDVYGWTDIIE